MEPISKEILQKLNDEIEETIKDLDLDTKRSRLGELETISMEPDFWGDQNRAKNVMKEIESIRKEVSKSEDLKKRAKLLIEVFEISQKEDLQQINEDYLEIQRELDKFQILKFLSGKYDKNDAIFSIHSGQGGTEANDWAEMLKRMYLRYFEKKEWKYEIQHLMPGTDVGLSTVTIIVEGEYAYGLLKNESGVHRLVRLSPFNSQNLRQTSFAGVEVSPVIEDDEDIELNDEDIEFKAVRSSGAGGQSVNKTSTAVQILHKPSGITVHNSESRSQQQNRENAMKILRSKLFVQEQEKREKELQELKGDHKIAAWGNQIRNYVLHPYKLVKDLRTGVESNNPTLVLDGEIDEFIEAETRIG